MKKFFPYIISIVIVIGVVLGFNFAMDKYQESKFVPEVPISNIDTQNPTTPPDPTKPAPPQDQGPKSTGAAIPILMYHEIGSGPNSLYVPVDKFRDQMNYLYKSDYHPVTMAAAQEMLVSGQIPPKTIVITFDDGYESCYTKALPIMQEFGFTGTFYVISSFSGRANYLTWDELKTLQAAGMEIGSHTQNHLDLKTASVSIQTEEILGSKKILEEKLGVPVKSFCYPIGAYNDDAVRIVKESGYTSAVTVAFGHSTCKNNYFLTPRVRVPGWITLNNFAKNIQL